MVFLIADRVQERKRMQTKCVPEALLGTPKLAIYEKNQTARRKRGRQK